MRGRKSMKGYLCGSMKKKATQSRNELAYMMMWGEEPPKKRTMRPKKLRASLW